MWTFIRQYKPSACVVYYTYWRFTVVNFLFRRAERKFKHMEILRKYRKLSLDRNRVKQK